MRTSQGIAAKSGGQDRGKAKPEKLIIDSGSNSFFSPQRL